MQGTLNFLKLNKLFSAAIDINICNISPEWSNWGNNNRKENDVEQWQSNSETHQINTFETMDITFIMLGARWVKEWTLLKGAWLWLPYNLCIRKKHTREPWFICSRKILVPKVSLPSIDAFFKYYIPFWPKVTKQEEGASSMLGRNVAISKHTKYKFTASI